MIEEGEIVGNTWRVFKAVAGVALWRPCALKWSKRN
jgi:hypothetical protein